MEMKNCHIACILEYNFPVREALFSVLRATEISRLCYALDITLRPQEKLRYLSLQNDMPEISEIKEESGKKGYNVLFIGRDLLKMQRRIDRPTLMPSRTGLNIWALLVHKTSDRAQTRSVMKIMDKKHRCMDSLRQINSCNCLAENEDGRPIDCWRDARSSPQAGWEAGPAPSSDSSLGHDVGWFCKKTELGDTIWSYEGRTGVKSADGHLEFFYSCGSPMSNFIFNSSIEPYNCMAERSIAISTYYLEVGGSNAVIKQLVSQGVKRVESTRPWDDAMVFIASLGWLDGGSTIVCDTFLTWSELKEQSTASVLGL